MCNNDCLLNLRFSGNWKVSHKEFDKEYTYTCNEHETVFTPGKDIIRCSSCGEWTFDLNHKLCTRCKQEKDNLIKIAEEQAARRRKASETLRLKRKQTTIDLHPETADGESKQVIGF